MPITQALSAITDQVVIVYTDDGRLWIPVLDINTIGDQTPGEGFMIITNEDVTFQYNDELQIANYDIAPADNVITEIPLVENAPAPTGKPYAVLVKGTDELRNLNPVLIEVYDSDRLVGASVWLEDEPVTPVIAWEGSSEYELDGFTPGNKINVKVLDEKGVAIGACRASSTSDDVDEQGGEVDNHQRSATSEDVAESIPFSVSSVRSVVQSGSVFGEGAYAEITVDRVDPQTLLPTEFTVGSAYPNPFNATLTVPFGLPRDGEISFEVFNILGQSAYSHSQHFEAGRHRFVLDNQTNLVSGLYFLNVKADGKAVTQKIMYLK
ncbi:T9SS type A sorting domain-containing protein [bacterium]|nr:T9SS type A sorting domain-containing protein [bacterium]